LEWDAYNEGNTLIDSVKRYKEKNGFYPEAVLADKIYRTKENRDFCKARGIHRGREKGSKKASLSGFPGAKRSGRKIRYRETEICYGLHHGKAKRNRRICDYIEFIGTEP